MSKAGRIPKEFIDQLLARVDIIDVIGGRVPLKKAGREYTACCPFHNEKTPSFTVSPTKQFYHCFGCGVHGSAITFLMEYEHLEYPEAIEALARTIGVPVPVKVQKMPQNARVKTKTCIPCWKRRRYGFKHNCRKTLMRLGICSGGA